MIAAASMQQRHYLGQTRLPCRFSCGNECCEIGGGFTVFGNGHCGVLGKAGTRKAQQCLASKVAFVKLRIVFSGMTIRLPDHSGGQRRDGELVPGVKMK